MLKSTNHRVRMVTVFRRKEIDTDMLGAAEALALAATA
jgi:hypothetical protein